MELERIQSNDNFPRFVRNIFSKSFEKFIDGPFVEEMCKFTQDSLRTMTVSSKYHFKSTRMYAFFMWYINKMKFSEDATECHYFSYQAEMASYHVGSKGNRDSIKALIKRNPYFRELIDNKPHAETVIDYSWRKGGPSITLTPHGMLTFKRGLHCNGPVFIDDALQDPAEKLNPRTIHRINDIFYSQLLDIPNDGVPLHVVGTAQTREDFYFDDRSKYEFDIKILPAVTNATLDEEGFITGGKALWPEWLSIEQLMSRQRTRGLKTFSQEYMCNPVYASDSFFKIEQLKPLVLHQNLARFDSGSKDVVAGYDLGKHRHPAHFCVFVRDGPKRKQLLSKWFDRVDYIDQIEYVRDAIERFGIDTVYYDATRGEYEAMEEKGDLPDEFEPMTFSRKLKHTLATEFEVSVNNKQIELVDDQRQLNQILAVTNDLDVMATKEGHGDSFWSIALTFADEIVSEPSLAIG